MLRKLRISNYALIEHLEIDLKPGFTAITGETGAGKSILLGALSLVLGSRADTNILHDKNNKCFVEATFDISKLDLKAKFAENDLEYEHETIFRREISISGKSRAFINDTPVNVIQMKELGEMLVDIHSQHDSLHLSDSAFQLNILDGLAQNENILADYAELYRKFQQCKAELNELKRSATDSKANFELLSFQLSELDKAGIQAEETELLEQRLSSLNHAEEIKSALFTVAEQLNRSEINAIRQIKDSHLALTKIQKYFPEAKSLAERLFNQMIEIKDIAFEAENVEQKVQYDPIELEKINNRLSFLRQLMLKHHCANINELIKVREQLQARINSIENKDFSIENLIKTLSQLEVKLLEKAKQLSVSRKKMIPEMERSVSLLLTQLGMPNARFVAQTEALQTFSPTGSDSLKFLFTANKGTSVEDIAKVASGGELSRLMLAIKSLTSGRKMIPTIIFDEIDTGVSGEIAAKVGRIMHSMAHTTQLIAITHLPQIAGKANHHLHVFKRDDDKRTKTMLIQLNESQRIDEIARMLSDDKITPASRNAAKELISGF
ncbi:MAG: DNA repair protein RecN [Bacteroidetes bacterium]|nr:DNA repair protein RecN [Bacteroidota bacterium]